MSRRWQRVLVVVAMTSAIGGCEAVRPWERGALARSEMQLDPNALQTDLYEQVYYSKEASRGGTRTAGAGCGCN